MDPVKRKESPDFYGYIPDDGTRTVIFGCMVLNSALLLLIRSFSAAMLILVERRYASEASLGTTKADTRARSEHASCFCSALINPSFVRVLCVCLIYSYPSLLRFRYFLIYLAGDMALYLLVKVASGDYHYWIPVDGAFGLFVSLILRMFIKIVTDFTGVIQFRNYPDLGGLYWTANMFLALLASFGSVWVGSGGQTEWTLMGAASGAWVLAFGLFLLLMKKEYRRTFFSTKPGKQWTMDFFLKGEDDEAKHIVFDHNKNQWRAIRGDVKEWVQANYWRWEAERPSWFTDSWVAKVPPDMIPSEAKQAAKEIRASARRRRSVGGGVAKEEETTRVEPVA